MLLLRLDPEDRGLGLRENLAAGGHGGDDLRLASIHGPGDLAYPAFLRFPENVFSENHDSFFK